jgi:serine/threonine-protein kinase
VREACVVNEIDHPGAVKIVEHGIAADGCPYLVMELLEGETAAQKRSRSRGRLREIDALRIADGALSVLDSAHARGIVHRDISPSNLFLTRDGAVRVLDFGIAAARNLAVYDTTLTRTGEILGTAAYMSPEQALGAHRCVDARSDLYSLGATLFRLLSSEWVFPAAQLEAQRAAIMTLSARSLASAMPDAHPATVQLVDRALCYERSGRWQTAREMRDACRSALSQLQGLASVPAEDRSLDRLQCTERATQRDLPVPELF